MKLSSKIYFADAKTKKTFESLKHENLILYKHVYFALEKIKEDCFCGIQIPKKLIPKEYFKKYNIKNLWKYNLPNAFRLLYSIESNEIIVLAIILEWMNHKEYERKFKY